MLLKLGFPDAAGSEERRVQPMRFVRTLTQPVLDLQFSASSGDEMSMGSSQ